MPIAYAANTDGCTFLLDEDGVCRRVLLKPCRPGERTLGGRTRAQAARRCIGAQYVASIDVRVNGGLVPMPLSGAPMLFAYAGDDGRLAVVRTGPLRRFETVGRGEAPGRAAADPDDTTEDDECMTVPLAQSGERPSGDVIFEDDDPWQPPPPAPSWPSLRPVRLQRVSLVPPSESAPTLERPQAPPGRGMLPRRANRA